MPNKTTAVCAARTNALVCNIHELITELEERIEDGEPFDNPKLTRTAERVFGGSRAQGKYTPRDAYDAVEIAVNNHLLEKHAARANADGRAAIRLTYQVDDTTKVVVQCQNERSQHKNRASAMSVLRSRLYALAQQRQREKMAELQGERRISPGAIKFARIR